MPKTTDGNPNPLTELVKRSLVDRAVQKFVAMHAESTGRAPPKSAIETYRRTVEADPNTDGQVRAMIAEVTGLNRRERVFGFAEFIVGSVATGLLGVLVAEYRAYVPAAVMLLLILTAAIHFRDWLRERLSWRRALALLFVFVAFTATYTFREDLLRAAARLRETRGAERTSPPAPK